MGRGRVGTLVFMDHGQIGRDDVIDLSKADFHRLVVDPATPLSFDVVTGKQKVVRLLLICKQPNAPGWRR